MSEQVRVSTLVGQTLAKLGVGHVFGVVGSGNFDITSTLMNAGIPYTAARHEAALPPWPMPTPGCRARWVW